MSNVVGKPGSKTKEALDSKATDTVGQTFTPEEERSVVDTALAQKNVVPPQEVPEEEIDNFAVELSADYQKLLKTPLESGVKVLDRFFDGSLTEAQDKNPLKQVSFAKLCRHKRLTIDATTLSKWVRAAALYRSLQEQGKVFKHLVYSHYLALLGMEDMSKRIALAEETENRKLSVRDLQKRIKELYPPAPQVLSVRIDKGLSNPRALVNDTGLRTELTNLETLRSKLGEADMESIGEKIRQQQKLMGEYLRILDQLNANLKKIAAEAQKKAA